jgi:signal transduction histidine kinase
MSEGHDRAPGPILIVDDNPANLLALAGLLEPLGRAVVGAASGREALERLAQGEVPVLILLDVRMPDLDGFDTLIRIREEPRWSQIPVVFVSAVHDDPADLARGYALGALDYVAKPIDSSLLLAKLRALMSWQERAEQLRRDAETIAREQATRAERERILGVVSHDLRSPLTTIRTGSDYLLARRDLPEDAVKVARRIQRNAERMSRLINDLLDFTRLQSGGLAIRPQASRLADIVVESVEDLRLSQARAIDLTVETQRAGRVDGDRLAQAVANLVGNAVQHSVDTSPVSVVLRERGDRFELSVWNAGELGADAHAIFEPFRKGNGSNGMGLGLYISQQIARAHGGEITVSSSPEAGTLFRLVLPAG